MIKKEYPSLSVLLGFIDFIVDPSFQVMGDMIEKVIAPIQKRSSGQDTGKMDKATSTASLDSRCSTPGTPRSPSSPGEYKLNQIQPLRGDKLTEIL